MSDAENNPYRPPPAAEPDGVVFADRSQRTAGPPVAQFMLNALTGDQRWQLEIHEDKLILDRGGATPLVYITRRGIVDQCDFIVGSFLRVISVRTPERIGIPLTPQALSGVRTWMEPVIDDVRAGVLKRRARSSLPVGLFVTFMSLPILASRTDWLGLAWGLGMLVLALAVRVTKHRAMFLADGCVWLLLAARNIPIAIERGSVLSGFFAALAVTFAFGSFGAFRFFRRAT